MSHARPGVETLYFQAVSMIVLFVWVLIFLMLGSCEAKYGVFKNCVVPYCMKMFFILHLLATLRWNKLQAALKDERVVRFNVISQLEIRQRKEMLRLLNQASAKAKIPPELYFIMKESLEDKLHTSTYY